MSLPEPKLPNCPPNDAKGVYKKVYRFVESDPPVQRDFFSISKKERIANNIRRKYKRTKAQECYAIGLSVFEDINEILSIKKNEETHNNDKIAECSLIPEYGLVKQTFMVKRKSHYTWWPVCGLTFFLFLRLYKNRGIIMHDIFNIRELGELDIVEIYDYCDRRFFYMQE